MKPGNHYAACCKPQTPGANVMRRITQVEAKSRGVFIESFESREKFMAVKWKLDALAQNDGRECAYIVLPFGTEPGQKRIVMYQVFLMPRKYKFLQDRD